jgi:hypothetical protein
MSSKKEKCKKQTIYYKGSKLILGEKEEIKGSDSKDGDNSVIGYNQLFYGKLYSDEECTEIIGTITLQGRQLNTTDSKNKAATAVDATSANYSYNYTYTFIDEESKKYRSTINAAGNFFKKGNIDSMLYPPFEKNNKLVNEYDSYATSGNAEKYEINFKIYLRENSVHVVKMTYKKKQ